MIQSHFLVLARKMLAKKTIATMQSQYTFDGYIEDRDGIAKSRWRQLIEDVILDAKNSELQGKSGE